MTIKMAIPIDTFLVEKVCLGSLCVLRVALGDFFLLDLTGLERVNAIRS